ncbi:hypothetical protein GF337_06640, partial [candidate division KSB1 bacterium]|nr:hypothetical protein [candidate division KSB1 bacterium]
MRIDLKIKILLALGIFVLPVLATGADIQISATVDRARVALNQTFVYTVEISGEKANDVGDPDIPDISAFSTYLGSSGTSQNIQIVNGKMSVSKSISFSYMTSKVGKFTIPPTQIKYGGTVYKTAPIDIEIVKEAASSQPQNRQQRSRPRSQSVEPEDVGDHIFLRPFISKKQVYVNEPVILSYKIYTAVTITSYGIRKQPSTAGFWAEEFDLGQQPKTHREMYKGREFLVAEIKKVALFPTDAGKKTIEPMVIECDVRIQNRRRSIFDSFFDDPFFGRTTRKSVASPSLNIEVLPLPEAGKPANFSGAVGNYSISATVDKNQVKTNEALAFKVRLAGTGNIKVLPEPEVKIPNDFEKYDPKVSENIKRSGNSVTGSKVMEYVLIPRFPGIQKIEPITYTYFDPAIKSYKKISTREIEITVEKGSEEFIVTGSGLSKEEVRLLGKDIRYIQKEIPEFRKIGAYYYRSPIYLFLLVLPMMILGSAVLYRRHLDKLSENVAYARSRKANQLAMNRLRKARRKLDDNTQKEFYAETSKALVGFLADKLNISAASIITDEVEEMMQARDIDPEVISQYLQCLQICDYQRFAPSTSSEEEMKRFYEQAKSAIIALEKAI